MLSLPQTNCALFTDEQGEEKMGVCATDAYLLFQVTTDQEPTEFRKQPIRTGHLGHVTGYQPIRDQYFLIRSVPATDLY